LEGFGNAATLVNINSSRFAKYIELNLSTLGHVDGGEQIMYFTFFYSFWWNNLIFHCLSVFFTIVK